MLSLKASRSPSSPAFCDSLIYSNKGAMTPGVTQETADGMSMEKIERIIDAMRHERYRFPKNPRTMWGTFCRRRSAEMTLSSRSSWLVVPAQPLRAALTLFTPTRRVCCGASSRAEGTVWCGRWWLGEPCDLLARVGGMPIDQEEHWTVGVEEQPLAEVDEAVCLPETTGGPPAPHLAERGSPGNYNHRNILWP